MKRKIKSPLRVIRGGSWLGGDPDYLVASSRGWHTPPYLLGNLGFRLVRAS